LPAPLAVGLRGPDGARAVLALDAKLVAAIVGVVLRVPAIPVLRPGALEQGLVKYGIAELLLALGTGCVWTLELEEPAAPASAWSVLEAEVELGDGRGLAWLAIDGSAARARLPLARERRARLDGARRELGVELARFRLPLAELEALGVDDLILSPGCPRSATSYSCLLRVGGGGFPGTATPGAAGALRVDEPFRRGGLGMSTESEGASQALAEELVVDVVVEHGRLSLSAAQVLDLEPGDVLALARPLLAAVDLRVGDRLIARGELVDVEGEAGVRLTEVFDS
jgi:type III secretion system YscQ/HrcQ family protein